MLPVHNLPFPTDGTDDQALFVGQDDWDDSLDGEGELDTTWDIEQEQDLASNGSSNTLSSKASKRGFDEVDPDFGDDVEDASPPSSPGMWIINYCFSNVLISFLQIQNGYAFSEPGFLGALRSDM